MEAAASGAVTAVPSASGSGTNALVTAPPTVIDFRFEGSSLAAFRDECATRGIAMGVVEAACFAIDVDTPADLSALPHLIGYRTCELLSAWGELTDAVPASGG
jgi:2-phospho-L-lactate guanylyltransferase (CobY/MobA/RfbA family)